MSKRKTCGKFSLSQEIQTSKSGFERHTRKGGKTNDIQVVLYLTNRIKRTISAGIWSCTYGIVHVNVAASRTTTTTTKSFMRCDNDFLLQGLRKYFLWSLLPIHHVYLYLYLHLHFFTGGGGGKGIGGRGTYVCPYIVVWMLKPVVSLGSLSTNVFERRTSTRSELFSPIICLDAAKFVLLSFFALIETVC